MRLECINTAFQVDMEPLSISQVHLTFFFMDAGIGKTTGLPNGACVSISDWHPRFQIPNASPGKIC